MPAMAVKIYTTPNCPYCHQAKDYFQDKNIPFDEIDVSQDPKALQEVIAKTGKMGVPVIEIGDKIIRGFNPEEIDQALSQSVDN